MSWCSEIERMDGCQRNRWFVIHFFFNLNVFHSTKNYFILKILDLGIFHIGKRIGYFVHWEPIYIGTNDDPHYDERLSWEGKSDKMTQVCYKFICLFHVRITDFFSNDGFQSLLVYLCYFNFYFDRVMHCVHSTMSFIYWIMHFWFINLESKY